LKKESLILCDTNICIYRTLALIDPPILPREELDKVLNLIADLTNNNFGCKVLVTDIILNELKDKEILFESVSDFCIRKLHWKRDSYKIQQLARKAEKSIDKFLDKRLIEDEILEKIKNYRINLPRINNFYLRYPEKLKELTANKIRYLKPFDMLKKIGSRPNTLPEENDRLLLCQAIEFSSLFEQDICIFSNDGDFKEFKNELLKELGITIIDSDYQLSQPDC